MKDNPGAIVKWTGITVTIVGLFSLVFTFTWIQNLDRLTNERWYTEDAEWNATQIALMADILSRQKAIEQALVVQSQRLSGLENRMIRHEGQVEVGFEEIQAEIALLALQIANQGIGIALEIGRHSGYHMATD